MRQIIFSIFILCSFAISAQRTAVQTAVMSGDTVLYKATYHDVYTFDNVDSVYVLDTTIMVHFDAEYPRPFPDTIEHALTFANGVTRTVNFVRNDLITGKSGGQTVVGGTASGDDLTISSTTNGTKGNINFGTSTYDELNNYLGVNDLSPISQLSVVGTTRLGHGYGYGDNWIPYADGNNYLRANNHIFANASATEYMRLTNAGNVGIGTTSPTAKLDVSGTVSATTSSDFGVTFNSSAAERSALTLNNSGGGDPLIMFSQGGTARWSVGYEENGSTYDFKIRTATASMDELYGSTKLAIQQSTGNLGIGTSVPKAKAHIVAGTSGIGTAPTGTVLALERSGDGENAYLYTAAAYNASAGLIFTDASQGDKGKILYNNATESFGLHTDGTEKVSILSSGNVGIGITNPSQSLTVSSPTTYEGILVKGNVAPNISFVQNAGTTPAYKVGLSGNDGTALSISSGAGATDLVHIKSDGNVGIGTTSPSQKLSILRPDAGWLAGFGANGVQDLLKIGYANTYTSGETTLESSPYGSFGLRTQNNRHLLLMPNGTGNVGVGTGSPAYKLDVSDKIYSASRFVSRFGLSSTELYNTSQTKQIYGFYGGVTSGVDNTFGDLYGMGYSYSTLGGAAFVDQHNVVFTSAGTVKATIGIGNGDLDLKGKALIAGNVGIGTASPSVKLDVQSSTGQQAVFSGHSPAGAASYNGDIRIGSNASYQGQIYYDGGAPTSFILNNVYNNSGSLIKFQVAGSDKMAIKGDGNVGIGTTSPSYALDVTGYIRATQNIRLENGKYLSFGSSSGEEGITGSQAANSLTLRTNGANRLHIDSDGEVGIGTLTPSAALDVVGNIVLSGDIKSTGKVGAGTSSPDRTLHTIDATALTNTITYPLRVSHATSGTPAISFGVGIESELENASGTDKVASAITTVWADPTNGTEDAQMEIALMKNGSLATGVVIDNDGNVLVTSETYGAGWSGSKEVPTKDDLYDKIESLQAAIIGAIYPVGSLYTSTLSTNPGTILGVGTWVAFGAGRVMVGIDAGQTEFDTVEETGGAKTHTLTVDEMPAHTHTISSTTADGGGTNIVDMGVTASGSVTTGSAGGGAAHNNLQPYIVVYMWKRTS